MLSSRLTSNHQKPKLIYSLCSSSKTHGSPPFSSTLETFHKTHEEVSKQLTVILSKCASRRRCGTVTGVMELLARVSLSQTLAMLTLSQSHDAFGAKVDLTCGRFETPECQRPLCSPGRCSP